MTRRLGPMGLFGALLALLALSAGCASSGRECHPLPAESYRPPPIWDPNWRPPTKCVSAFFVVTVGIKPDATSLPWRLEHSDHEIWFGPETLAALVDGRLTTPGSKPLRIGRNERRRIARRLRVAAENQRHGSIESSWVYRLLQTGFVAVKDLESNEFSNAVYFLSIDVWSNGLGGWGNTYVYNGHGRILTSAGWEA